MQKTKKKRVKGKALVQLNTDIHERDGHTCIIKGCDRYILPGEKFHHDPCGPDKQDIIQQGCLLCSDHHYTRHHGREGLEEVRQQCVDYLSNLYPDHWARIG